MRTNEGELPLGAPHRPPPKLCKVNDGSCTSIALVARGVRRRGRCMPHSRQSIHHQRIVRSIPTRQSHRHVVGFLRHHDRDWSDPRRVASTVRLVALGVLHQRARRGANTLSAVPARTRKPGRAGKWTDRFARRCSCDRRAGGHRVRTYRSGSAWLWRPTGCGERTSRRRSFGRFHRCGSAQPFADGAA